MDPKNTDKVLQATAEVDIKRVRANFKKSKEKEGM
jgi:hypothetical protein